jgi:hypothetical protein
MRMRRGFCDVDELRTRHAALKAQRDLERALLHRAIDTTHAAVAASWKTLGQSRATVEAADRFSREREIQLLADDFLRQERALIEMKDDGQILAAIFPAQRSR